MKNDWILVEIDENGKTRVWEIGNRTYEETEDAMLDYEEGTPEHAFLVMTYEQFDLERANGRI